jgi:ABC-type uncharacterized transport system permease subunit
VLVAAVAIGGMFGLMLAALVVTFRMDQIIAGVVINLFVLGLTSYVTSQVFAEYRWMNNAEVFRKIKIPFLSISRCWGRCCSARTSSSTAR